MTPLRAFAMAFVTYSRVPMPRFRWDEKSAGYQLCFFPAVGLLIGAVMMGVGFLCDFLGFSPFFRAAMMAAVPVILTGGIHLDGFLDTVDALSSFAPKEKKLEILKDSNAGAFAVIYACLWFLCYTAALSELRRLLIVASVGCVLSRALSAIAVLTFRSARENGMGAGLKKQSSKTSPLVASVLWLAAGAAALAFTEPVGLLVVIPVCGLEFLHYRLKSYREFGGFTGDLAGWFLCRLELELCLAAAVVERIVMVWF